MSANDTVMSALKLAKLRLVESPNFKLYASCVAQLEYLQSVLDGSVLIDRPKLRTIILGHYGVREFEDTDPEFAIALKESQLIASKMADGLKV